MKRKKWAAALLAGMTLVLLLGACGGEKLKWPETGLGTVLPQPGSAKGRIGADSADSFSADIEPASPEDYSAYVGKCREAGFTTDSVETSDEYTAYNSEGYRLRLWYSEYSKGYSIHLDAPKVNGTFQWPATGLALLLPQPGTDVGTISVDSSSQFNAYIGKTSKEDYLAYVDQCMEWGFTVDYDKGDTYFSAHNENGDSLFIEYQGFQTMYISMYASDLLGESSETGPSEGESFPAEEASTAPASGGEASEALPEESEAPAEGLTGIRPEFKEAMDAYEAFFEEYAAFMEKYRESENTADLLADYTDFLKRYTETMEKLGEIGEEEMSTEEALYYSEVMLRISQKLSQAAE